MTTTNPDISVVVPLYNEVESLPELLAWIQRVMAANNFSYEVVFVDDGSSDNSWNVVKALRRKDPHVKGIRFRRNYGKSAALYCGFEAAQGEVVITMDADLQDSPDEIPELYRMITQERYDLVSGWKKRRHDPIGKTWPSKFFNFCARSASGIKLHDFNCGLKAYRKKVVKSIEVYGEMHRFIPLLAKSAGFKQIGEKVVQHQARKYGVSKFGWERMIKGYLDLITVLFISKFGKSPMYFFGGLGTLMFLVGGATTVALIVEKLYKQAHAMVIRNVTDQPLFYIAIAAAIVGVQLFLAGFLGELIGRNSGERNRYLIDERIEADDVEPDAQKEDTEALPSKRKPKRAKAVQEEEDRDTPATAESAETDSDKQPIAPDEEADSAAKAETGAKPKRNKTASQPKKITPEESEPQTPKEPEKDLFSL